MLTFSERSLFDDALFWLVVSNRFGTNTFQQAAYQIVWRECVKNVAHALPDAFIYVRTPLELCFDRMVSRSRQEERGGVTTREYLRKIMSMHDSAFLTCTKPVCVKRSAQLRVFDAQSVTAVPELLPFTQHLVGKQVVVINDNQPTWVNEAVDWLGLDDGELCLSGCIAAGKSTVLEYIKQQGEHATRAEPLDLWCNDSINLLEAFNTVPEKSAFEFQMVAFISRAFNCI